VELALGMICFHFVNQVSSFINCGAVTLSHTEAVTALAFYWPSGCPFASLPHTIFLQTCAYSVRATKYNRNRALEVKLIGDGLNWD